MKLPVDLLEQAEIELGGSRATTRMARADMSMTSVHALDGQVHVELRKQMLAMTVLEDVADAFERYMGSNDLLPINYLEKGLRSARSVGLIRYFDTREGKPAVATGFMVSPDLMMTNHHVFPVGDVADFHRFFEDASVEFGNEYDVNGSPRTPICFDLDPNAFFYSWKNLDMALVAVRRTSRGGQRPLADQGYLVLNGELGKAGIGEFATVIQHAEGKPKQIALRNNEIVDLSHPSAVGYASDTAQGSSGAPVFNNEWQVIALHSAGVAKRNASGQLVDKNDQVIEVVNDKVDGSRLVWERNRGIRVSALIAHLRDNETLVSKHPLVLALFHPAYTDRRPLTAVDPSDPSLERKVVLSEVPASSIPPITVHISIGGHTLAALGSGAPSLLPEPALLELEKKFEDSLDFSGCEGYQDDFMGVRIPMPIPSASLRKKLAYHLASPSLFLLKYHHYSVFHHAVRRVPIVSAINAHSKYRYKALDKKESRVDKWFRDNRIDYDVQLNDAWYAHSGFDRGHLARREDGEWGQSEARAYLAANMTCAYTNAIPQVPALNRHGDWGDLEQKLLEQGIELESGKSGRICVFGGPLFEADDPVFKGVQVALNCYKIVVWFDGDGDLRTTCFRLSQVDLVGQIEFEVLNFDKIFKTHQCPLTTIERATGLIFPKVMHDSDTSGSGEEELSEESLERLVMSRRKPVPVG